MTDWSVTKDDAATRYGSTQSPGRATTTDPRRRPRRLRRGRARPRPPRRHRPTRRDRQGHHLPLLPEQGSALPRGPSADHRLRPTRARHRARGVPPRRYRRHRTHLRRAVRRPGALGVQAGDRAVRRRRHSRADLRSALRLRPARTPPRRRRGRLAYMTTPLVSRSVAVALVALVALLPPVTSRAHAQVASLRDTTLTLGQAARIAAA